ncbi:MAG: hypothetical protein K2X09_03275 [Rickettsiales bacterium]|nr:hypothetical protein [Rickettsiales bacterium]
MTNDGLPKISRKIKPEARLTAIDRARDGYGRVICEHCTREIRDDQQITMNHKFQWQDLRGQFASDVKFQSLGSNAQQNFLKHIFNDAGNLQPLHVACHNEVDFGLHYTPEEEERINRKINEAPRTKVTGIKSALPLPAPSPDPERLTLRDYYPEYHLLLAQRTLSANQWERMEQAPYLVMVEYQRLTEGRLANLQKRLAAREDQAAANEAEARYKTIAITGLSDQIAEISKQAMRMDSLISSKFPQRDEGMYR